MFKAASNPYDDIVAKATDENQTSEDWGLLATVWDKVNDDGATGARNAVLAIQKRLQHRNANVQLYALTLSDSLINNCKVDLHREISSRAFTQTLTRLVQDRTTHEKVKRRTMQLLKNWSETFKKDETLGMVEETYEILRKSHRFEAAVSSEPAPIPHSVLKQEEEDIQRAIRESEALARNQQSRPGYVPSNPSASTSYAPAAPVTSYFTQADGKALPDIQPQASMSHNASNGPSAPRSQAPSRVKALYDFEPQEDGELAFRKGDVIRVVNSAYEGWWKGELDGRIGIFPLTYIEIIPDPTPESIARDAETEAQVFAQAGSVDRLLAMLSAADAQNSSISEDDDLMELYQQCILLRPKIVKLLDKYSQKQKDLSSLHDKFKVAKTAYDSMLEECYQRNHQRGPYGSGGQPGYAATPVPGPQQGAPQQQQVPLGYGYPHGQQQPGQPPLQSGQPVRQQSYYPGQQAPAGSPYPGPQGGQQVPFGSPSQQPPAQAAYLAAQPPQQGYAPSHSPAPYAHGPPSQQQQPPQHQQQQSQPGYYDQAQQQHGYNQPGLGHSQAPQANGYPQ